ncbi:MAG: aminopeptidase P family protein [Muribaculaceae bacterium]|nr:aminopeptidase P family protein [Muribaculaceae bacterium]
MNNVYTERLAALRRKMAADGIAAVIVPQADPHLSEYLASHWQVRRWLSGFTGSAGDLVVTATDAALWTDSRYFLQAADQLAGTGIRLMKDGLADTPTITEWLCKELKAGERVGLDGMLFTQPQVTALADALGAKGISLCIDYLPVADLWTDRPALPSDPIFVHDIAYAGEAARDKMAKILQDAREKGASAVLSSALDDIAWTLNIRSNDVKYTPVVTSFLYIDGTGATLFVDDAKLSEPVKAYLASEGVTTRPYDDIKTFLSELPADARVLADAGKTVARIMDLLGDRAVVGGISKAAVLKSVKNDVQLNGVRHAMVRDGAALVKAFMELEQRLAEGVKTTEMDFGDILHKYRSQGENYKDESFGSIVGYGPHGAIVHYEADEHSNATLKPEGLLLVDSGAQYLDGTTDITRTVCLGTPTAQEKKDFTLVMKGHIALGTAIFPEGTRGAQLDALARQFLWQHGMNYLHGTGHGVGHFLGVHEGPHSIRLNNVEAPLLPGSITSNEPGVYLEGVHGIRCENLVLCRKDMRTDFGQFLSFETLTLFPFDRSLFDLSLMTEAEIEWVDKYHATVAERLMPTLDTDEQRAWLKAHTAPLKA